LPKNQSWRLPLERFKECVVQFESFLWLIIASGTNLKQRNRGFFLQLFTVLSYISRSYIETQTRASFCKTAI